MIVHVLESVDHNLDKNVVHTLDAPEYSEWVFSVPKELYRKVRGKCMEQRVDWKGVLRHELYVFALDLYAQGHLKKKPGKK